MKNDLKMTPTLIDPPLYCQFEDDQLVGINGSYTDDLPLTETNGWKTHSDATFERFKIAGNQQAPFTLAGVHIAESDSM